MKKYLLITLVLSFFVVPQSWAACTESPAGTFTAASTSQSDVEACITDSSNGELVVVPSGGPTAWASDITVAKEITIQGATTGCPDACNDGTVITTNGFNVTADNVRITGFTSTGSTGSLHTIGSAVTNFRIDHNEIDGYPAAVAFHYNSLKYGLIDNNYIEDCSGECIYIKGDGNTAWVDGGAGGSYTDGTIYIEDNIFDLVDGDGSNIVDSGGGARWVFRYNTVNETSHDYYIILAAHGHYYGEKDGTDAAGTYLQEVYNNTFNVGNSRTQGRVLRSRGGRAYVYNNTINDSGQKFNALATFWVKDAASGDSACDVAAHADYYGGTEHTASYDGECLTADWPCPLQTNNSYVWGNTALTKMIVTETEGAQDVLQEDRDYWDDVGAGDTNFTTGLAASLPGTCTVDDSYFATDTLTLYNCETTNNWTEIYTQFPYPHYLQKAGTAALTGTLVEAINESDIRTGSKELKITLNGDIWALTADFDAIRADIIAGLDSAQSEGTGWNAVLRDAGIDVGDVVRTSDLVVTITLDTEAGYTITADETITVTIPATATLGLRSYGADTTFKVLNQESAQTMAVGSGSHTLTYGSGSLTLTRH